jgi:hypothetical protein
MRQEHWNAVSIIIGQFASSGSGGPGSRRPMDGKRITGFGAFHPRQTSLSLKNRANRSSDSDHCIVLLKKRFVRCGFPKTSDNRYQAVTVSANRNRRCRLQLFSRVPGAPGGRALPVLRGSRLAPPTRAPSISGWVMSSCAFSGLTLPPY